MTLKEFLRVTHDEDDSLLAGLLLAAEIELERYLEVSELPAGGLIELATFMLVRANYDAETPADAELWRNVARTTAHSYRTGMGA